MVEWEAEANGLFETYLQRIRRDAAAGGDDADAVVDRMRRGMTAALGRGRDRVCGMDVRSLVRTLDLSIGIAPLARSPHQAASRLASFTAAFAGITHVIVTQTNFRIELVATVAVIVVGVVLGLSSLEWAIVLFIATAILALECGNTALEILTDLVSPGIYPLAKAAKDTAAAALLFVVIGSLAAGVAVFGPRLVSAWHAPSSSSSMLDKFTSPPSFRAQQYGSEGSSPLWEVPKPQADEQQSLRECRYGLGSRSLPPVSDGTIRAIWGLAVVDLCASWPQGDGSRLWHG